MHRINERGYSELVYEKRHLTFDQLRDNNIQNGYLYNYVPSYPKYVEFQVSRLRHNTNLQGYHGIWDSEGFKSGSSDDLVWWSPDISKKDISNAEQQYLKKQNIEEIEKPFLHKFTTSPAFLSSSRLGNFRFSMPIYDLIKAYQQQFCEGQMPNIRIFQTVVYKQEVMYSVVIHAPHEQRFINYPRLRENALCVFRNNKQIIWRPQAMSETHSFRLCEYTMQAIRIPRYARQYHVWDNIGVAFHVPYGEIFQFHKKTLIDSLRLCEGAQPKINTENFVTCEFGSIRP